MKWIIIPNAKCVGYSLRDILNLFMKERNIINSKFVGYSLKDIESVHEGKKPFLCSHSSLTCTYFTLKWTLNSHVASVHEGKKPFKCIICVARLPKTVGLNCHVESVHEGKKPFKWKDCDTDVTSKKDLYVHVKTVHERVKHFKCDTLVVPSPRLP